MGKAVKRVTKAVSTGGISELGGLLKGKEVTTNADPLAGGIKELAAGGVDIQRQGLDTLKKYGQGGIEQEVAQENRLIRGAGEDARRKTQELIAKQGLGGTSIGLGQQIATERDTANKIAANNATIASRARNLATGLIGAGQGLVQQRGPIQMDTVKERRGGLGQLVGTLGGAALGGSMGGVQGAQLGSQLGGGLGGFFQYS